VASTINGLYDKIEEKKGNSEAGRMSDHPEVYIKFYNYE